MLKLTEHTEYQVQDGDTLQSIADSAGITWQELALYNWETDDPAKVNIKLREKVGSRKKKSNGRDYILSGKDDPGIIYLPKKELGRPLGTSTMHTLTVKVKEPVCVKQPNSAPGDIKGKKCSFYRWRFEDFLTRHKDCDHEPPVYYYGPLYKGTEDTVPENDRWFSKTPLLKQLNPPYPVYNKGIPLIHESYGFKYCHIFSHIVSPKLSDPGKEWNLTAKRYLQEFLERGVVKQKYVSQRDNGWNRRSASQGGLEDIELDNSKFQNFVFATHVDAYIEAGLFSLSIPDQTHILFGPDLREFRRWITIRQMLLMAKEYGRIEQDGIKDKLHAVADYYENIYKDTADKVRDLIRRFRG